MRDLAVQRHVPEVRDLALRPLDAHTAAHEAAPEVAVLAAPSLEAVAVTVDRRLIADPHELDAAQVGVPERPVSWDAAHVPRRPRVERPRVLGQKTPGQHHVDVVEAHVVRRRHQLQSSVARTRTSANKQH